MFGEEMSAKQHMSRNKQSPYAPPAPAAVLGLQAIISMQYVRGTSDALCSIRALLTQGCNPLNFLFGLSKVRFHGR